MRNLKFYAFAILFLTLIACETNNNLVNEETQIEESELINEVDTYNRSKAKAKGCEESEIKILVKYTNPRVTEADKERIRSYYGEKFKIYEINASRKCFDMDMWTVDCEGFHEYFKDCTTGCTDENTSTDAEFKIYDSETEEPCF